MLFFLDSLSKSFVTFLFFWFLFHFLSLLKPMLRCLLLNIPFFLFLSLFLFLCTSLSIFSRKLIFNFIDANDFSSTSHASFSVSCSSSSYLWISLMSNNTLCLLLLFSIFSLSSFILWINVKIIIIKKMYHVLSILLIFYF